MRPITKYLSMFTAAIAITAALPMSGAAAAMFDAFIKFGDIKGETADKAARGTPRIGQEVVVQVDTWSWGATAARVNKVDSLTIKKTAGARP
jgi:hypothetical protein